MHTNEYIGSNMNTKEKIFYKKNKHTKTEKVQFAIVSLINQIIKFKKHTQFNLNINFEGKFNIEIKLKKNKLKLWQKH